jgi:predicted dehydrogenase
MGKTVSIALVGISGFGSSYVNRILNESKDGNIRLVAVVDISPEKCGRLQELRDMGAEVYSSLDSFYGSGGEADLVIIVSPIHFHAHHTLTALENGSHVLCEKPAAATIQDAIRMAETGERLRKLVSIGYQWSYSSAIQALKSDAIAGVFGKPVRFKTFISWPRSASYYTKRHWAARVKSEGGQWILDSPVHNATAHYLHNCFYILGKTRETSSMPVDVQAELYRANTIENYDTAALRAHTEDGVEILHFVSHAVPSDIGPVISYEFERATIIYERHASNTFIARSKSGSVKNYGDPEDGGREKFWTTVNAVRTGGKSLCDVRAAIPQMLCANGAQESMEVVNFPDTLVRKTGSQEDPLTVVNGLQAALLQCFNLGILPHEHGGVHWARKSQLISLKGYRHFPSLLGNE